MLLPGCGLDEARQQLEAIRRELRADPFPMAGALPARHQPGERVSGDGLAVTMSFGLTLHGDGEPSAEVVRRADRALYAAKKAGRDCIRVDRAVDLRAQPR